MPVARDRNEEAALACRNFADRHNGRIATFLRAAGIGHSTWQDWLNERTSVPMWALTAIYDVSADLLWLAEMNGAHERSLVITINETGESGEDLKSSALEASHAHGRLSLSIVEALADDRLDHEEKRQIDAHCSRTQRAIEKIKQVAARVLRRPITVAAKRVRGSV